MKLSKKQQERYSRQLPLKNFGIAGQIKLLKSSVLIIGAGGLGSPACLYLAAAGVGRIGVVDADCVFPSNLQRQILHNTDDIGRMKARSAFTTLKRLNPEVAIDTLPVRFDAENGGELVTSYDFVLDCTDNFESKFLIADVCANAGKPYSHAGVSAYSGQTMTVIPGESACYRCVFDAPPHHGTVMPPDRAGVLGPVPGVIGSIQASEAIKFVIGAGKLLTNRLLCFDALDSVFRTVQIARNPKCSCCGGLKKPHRQ